MFRNFQQGVSKTFKEPIELTKEQSQLLDWALGLGGETGEVQDDIKHHIFHGEALDRMHLAKELGDVMWYIAAIATTTKMNLYDVLALNQAKLSHRYEGAGFDIDKSAMRALKEAAFKNTPLCRCLEASICHHEYAPVNVFILGPDGSGKTTLSLALAEMLRFKRIKCDYRQDNKAELAHALLDSEINVIYDRFYYPDEIIYSKAKDLPITLSTELALEDVFKHMLKLNPIFIFVDASHETLVNRSTKWADDYVQVKHLAKIQEAYDEFIHKLERVNGNTVPYYYLDTTDISEQDGVMMVKGYIDIQRRYYAEGRSYYA